MEAGHDINTTWFVVTEENAANIVVGHKHCMTWNEIKSICFL